MMELHNNSAYLEFSIGVEVQDELVDKHQMRTEMRNSEEDRNNFNIKDGEY